MSEQSTSPGRMIGLTVSPGVKGANLGTYYVGCMAFIMLATFLPGSQPYLLSEFLNLPESEHGKISGFLNTMAELVIIATIGLFGTMSDKAGRRIVMVIGFSVVALAFFLIPQARTVTELLAYRLVYAVGIAAVTVMVVTIVADYVQDQSRGKATGYVGIMNGLGALVAVFVLIKLPEKFVAGGMTSIEAGTRTYWVAASIALAIAALMWLGLKKKGPQDKSEDRPAFFTMVGEGVSAARDPGVALAYGASFVARGNFAIAGTFLTLWGKNYGVSELGMEPETALARAGMVLGISYAGALIGAPIFGMMTDRVSRTTALMVTLASTATCLILVTYSVIRCWSLRSSATQPTNRYKHAMA